jgi:hypothetical protein
MKEDSRYGARRRVRRIPFRSNWSIAMALFVIWMVFVLTVLIPWMVRHPHDDQHEHGHAGPALSR